MDQLAPAIAWIKKNIFWLACGLLLIAMIAMWFVATIGLAEAQQKNESSVKTKITLAQGIRQKKPVGLDDEADVSHPNQATQDGMQKELQATFDAIVKAWKLRVAEQKDILVWPDVIGNEQFQEVFAKFDPPEIFPKKYDARVEALLQLYRENIIEHMNQLAGPELLRSNWRDPTEVLEDLDSTGTDDNELTSGGKGGGPGGFGTGRPGVGGGKGPGGGKGSGGPAGPGMDNSVSLDLNQYAVIWSDVNQELWINKLMNFQGRDDNPGRDSQPDAAAMLYVAAGLVVAGSHVQSHS